MAQLYDISFETHIITRKIGPRKQITEERTTRPITMTALPWATAQSYNVPGVVNFQISPHDEQRRYSSRGNARPQGVGNGHKHVSRGSVPVGVVAAKQNQKSALQKAASTGDMTAAINRS